MVEANNWFTFAQEDLKVAELSFKGQIYNQSCFHAQQGVEKMLKGFLRTKGGNIPKVHSLAQLLTLCSKLDKDFEKFRAHGVKLDDYYIPTRYPDALPGMLPEGMPGQKDAREALAILKEITKFVENRI